MRKIPVAVCLALFIGVLAATANAQRPSASQTPVARALVKLEDDWTVGLMKRDTMLFKRITDPRFIYTEDATVMTREEVIHGIVTSPDKVEWAGNEDMRAHEFGPAAIVTGSLVVKSRGKKGPYTTRYRFTDTWLNKSGTWQIIGAQDYVIPDKKK